MLLSNEDGDSLSSDLYNPKATTTNASFSPVVSARRRLSLVDGRTLGSVQPNSMKQKLALQEDSRITKFGAANDWSQCDRHTSHSGSVVNPEYTPAPFLNVYQTLSLAA
jgi:hypothetical protein